MVIPIKTLAVVGVVIVIAIALWTAFGGGGGPWETENARMFVVALDKDGKEVALSGNPLLRITIGGTTISAIKALVQVKGTSPDFANYQVESSSRIYFQLITAGEIMPFYEKELTGSNLQATNPRTLPFDDAWYNLATATDSGVGWELQADGWWNWNADHIVNVARTCPPPGVPISQCPAAGDTIHVRFGFEIVWTIPEDISGGTPTPSQQLFVDVDVVLEANEANLTGKILTGTE